MKTTMKKSLIILFALALVMMTMALPAVSANASVSITFDDAAMESASGGDGLLVSNLVPTTTDNTNINDYEGHYIEGGIITFNFDTAMDVSTLTPANIKIKLTNATVSYMGGNPNYNSATGEWTYTPCEVTATSYSIAISEMCEGKMKHTVTFTSGVKTAGGEAINEVSKNFQTGRIVTTQGVTGKHLMDVAYGKNAAMFNGDDGSAYVDTQTDRNPAKLVDFQQKYEPSSNSAMTIPGNDRDRYVRIDLGNYYNVYDVVLYEEGWGTAANSGRDIEAYYTNDPSTKFDDSIFRLIGEFPVNSVNTAGQAAEGSSYGGRGLSRFASPAEPFRARYIIIKTKSQYGERAAAVRVIAEVETDYGQMTAKKGGSTLTKFAGTGTYEVSVPVSGKGGDAYMIIAAYDSNGIVTKIECAKVSVSGGKYSLSTTIENSSSKSLKAILIKSFNEPQMLTDALILPAQ